MALSDHQPQSSRKGRSVAVFGGGPGGMTAAHELAERGFDVTIYERHSVVGGKVRSWGVPDSATAGRKPLPADFGPHGMLGGYRNMVETLERIPTEDGGNVLDNFEPIPLEIALGGRRTRLAIPELAAMVNSASPDICTRATMIGALSGIAGAYDTHFGDRFTLQDTAILVSKVLALLTSGPKRQWGSLEHTLLADFVGMDQLSTHARDVFEVMATISSPTSRMNTRAFATGLLQIYLGSLIHGSGEGRAAAPILRLPTGPFHEVWWEPWQAHLATLGAHVRTDTTLTHLSCENGRITGATVRNADGGEENVVADYYVLGMPADKAAQLMTDEIVAADPALGRIKDLGQYWLGADTIYLTTETDLPELGTTVSQWMIAISNQSSNFWKRNIERDYGDGQVRSIISLDIAFWDKPGVFGKPANQCTPRERIEDVRAQIQEHCGDNSLLADGDIHSISYCPAVSLQNGAVVHDEPMFAPTPSCWQNQPTAHTAIPNLFLAASYVRNSAAICSTEAANEAGKHAANAVLAAVGDSADPAPITDLAAAGNLAMAWEQDDRRYEEGLPNAFDLGARATIQPGLAATV